MTNGRMSNSELSDFIKNYIKDMFDTNIKTIIEQHNTIIIDLKDTILDLQTQIKNNNNHNDSNTILYSSMVTRAGLRGVGKSGKFWGAHELFETFFFYYLYVQKNVLNYFSYILLIIIKKIKII